jgi:predicted site-specific integrase-resolvase
MTARPGAARPQPGPRLYLPGEVAALFRVDPVTVTRWGNTGKLTAIRLPGGHRRYLADEVDALLNGDGR